MTSQERLVTCNASNDSRSEISEEESCRFWAQKRAQEDDGESDAKAQAHVMQQADAQNSE